MLTMMALLAAAAVPADAGFQSNKEQGLLSISAGDQLVVRYRYAPSPYKPYVDAFCTPKGINVLRDAPSDHKHHHGLMFAIAVDGVNFWEEGEVAGKQASRSTSPVGVAEDADLKRARFTQQIDWIDSRSDAVLLREERQIGVCRAANLPASLLTWKSKFTLPPGKDSATLSGSQYFGLGARFVQTMDNDGHFQNADGKTGVKGTNLVRSNWCAFTASADGQPVTVAMFDYPSNTRHPATWFSMGDEPTEFAYLAATLNLEQEPLILRASDAVEQCYGVALWDGQIDAPSIDALYQRWIALQGGKAKR